MRRTDDKDDQDGTVPCKFSMQNSLHNGCISLHSMHNTGDVLAGEIMQERKLEIKDIQPDMFHLTEKRTDLLCDYCERRGVTYREKGGGRKTGPKRRFICESCYSRAVSREVMTYKALPGLLPLHRMKKTDWPLGRCHLCSLHQVTWV